MRITRMLLSLLFLAGASSVAAAPVTGEAYKVTKDFATKPATKKKPAQPNNDLSGVACEAVTGDDAAARRCLFISDELKDAEFAVVEKLTITPTAPQALIGAAPAGDIVGQPPTQNHCLKNDDFKEFDGEGVALSNAHYYVVGSHGCSRNSGEWRLSQFVLAKVPVTASGSKDGKPDGVLTTWRLSEALLAADDPGGVVKAAFGRPLDDKTNGLGIEGLAVNGDDLFVGLRSPAENRAFLLRTSEKALFDATPRAPKATSSVMTLELGDRVGIRDLAWLEPGEQLLLLAGPAQKQPTGYSIFVVDLAKKAATCLAKLAPITDDKGEPITFEGSIVKPEGMALLGLNADTLTLLITYDGVHNGMPHRFKVPRKPDCR